MQYLRKTFRVYMPASKEYRDNWDHTFGRKDECQPRLNESANSAEPESEQLPVVRRKGNSLPVPAPRSEANVF